MTQPGQLGASPLERRSDVIELLPSTKRVLGHREKTLMIAAVPIATMAQS